MTNLAAGGLRIYSIFIEHLLRILRQIAIGSLHRRHVYCIALISEVHRLNDLQRAIAMQIQSNVINTHCWQMKPIGKLETKNWHQSII